MSTKNVILIDFDATSNWAFKSTLEQNGEEWVVKKKVTNRLYGKIKKLIRIFYYFAFPLSIVFHKKRYDKIIAWQQFYGLNLAFFCRLFHLKKTNDLTVMTFIYRRRSGILGTLYHRYVNYCINSHYIDRIICFSKEETHTYPPLFSSTSCYNERHECIPIERKFLFVPLGKGNTSTAERNNDDEGYIFAVGRSNRNYDFLIDALENSGHKVIIACDTYKRKNVPDNTTILNNCHGQDMLKLMKRCHCVAIPLNNMKISAGQLVILQAMSLGKPIICTKSDGVIDYITNGENGILIDNEKEKWLASLSKLYNDNSFYRKMSENARSAYRSQFTENAMYERIAKLIK